MIRATQKIGKPGAPRKWKQPAGTSLYHYRLERVASSARVYAFRDSIFSDNGENIIRVKSGAKNPNNCWVKINLLSQRYASRSWGAPGADPRTEARVLSNSLNGDTPTVTDDLVESPSCSPADVEVSHAILANRFFPCNSTTSPVNFRVQAREDDSGSGGTICEHLAIIDLEILVPNNVIDGTPGATAYPESQLTLVNKT